MFFNLRKGWWLLLIIILWLGSEVDACAQQTSYADTLMERIGNPPDSLFGMGTYQPDPEANYIYAYQGASIHFEQDEHSITAIIDHFTRLKVLTEDGKKAALVDIPYYFDKDIEEIQGIRGYTYAPDGSRTPLDLSSIKNVNINSRYNVREFTMPDVKKGSVIEYRYRLKRKYIEELPDFYLSHQVPTVEARIVLHNPKYLRYTAVPVNIDSSKVHYKRTYIDTSSVPKIFTIPQPEPILVESWTAENLPAVQKTAYISSLDDYRGKLKFQMSEFGIPRQKLENSWDLVVAKIRHDQRPLKVMDAYPALDSLGQSIAEGMGSREEIQDSIFHYVNNKMKFNGKQSAFSDLDVSHVLQGQLNDQATINNALLAMLRGAGIKAYPLLISSRNFGRINRSFPSVFQFNSMLIYSEINGQQYFMDASFPYSRPNLIPVKSYNETGLVLKKEDYNWVNISPDNSMFSIKVDIKARLDAEGNLTGSMHTSNQGYPAQIIRKKLGDKVPEGQIIEEALFDGYTNIQLDSVEISNFKKFSEPVEARARFKVDKYATSYKSGLEFNPMIVGYLMNNPFQKDQRDLPVTLDAPEHLDVRYELSFPRGFHIERSSEDNTMQIPGARLKEMYRVENNKIIYHYNIDIARKNFSPELYPQLLNIYQRWVDLSKSRWFIKK